MSKSGNNTPKPITDSSPVIKSPGGKVETNSAQFPKPTPSPKTDK